MIVWIANRKAVLGFSRSNEWSCSKSSPFTESSRCSTHEYTQAEQHLGFKWLDLAFYVLIVCEQEVSPPQTMQPAGVCGYCRATRRYNGPKTTVTCTNSHWWGFFYFLFIYSFYLIDFYPLINFLSSLSPPLWLHQQPVNRLRSRARSLIASETPQSNPSQSLALPSSTQLWQNTRTLVLA